MPKETNDMASFENYTKYPAENAKVIKHGGSAAIHDAVVRTESPIPPLKKGSYEKGRGELAEAPEN